MLKETTATERAEARGRQCGFDLQVEAIELRDADSRRALADAQELYASAEARATVVIKQEEDLTARTRQVNQRAREVEELERRLLEREELDGITSRSGVGAPPAEGPGGQTGGEGAAAGGAADAGAGRRPEGAGGSPGGSCW
jgi:hypothetical protein